MQSLILSLDNDKQLMAMPDTQAHFDGHPVLTYNYHLYKRPAAAVSAHWDQDQLLVNHNHNPDYLGYITFEIPGKVFTYIPDGTQALSSHEIEEVVEQIMHIRDNPQTWPVL